MAQHPSQERLLKYADGELGTATREAVSEHVVECSDCQAWLAELETGLADYKHNWLPILKETAVAPPAPWFDLRVRLIDLDRMPEPATRSFPLPARWAAAAAVIVIAIATAYRLSVQPVSAAQLLSVAADREAAAQQGRPPIRIRSGSRSIVRHAIWRQRSEPAIAAADRERAESLRVLFESGNYSWENPLSARSFSAWRNSLPDRYDRLSKPNRDDGSGSYEISTRTNSGPLVEVRLALRASDLHATHGSWRFRGDELIEITEMPDEVVDSPAARSPVEPPSTSPQQEPQAARPISSGEELRVRAVLRALDADLGEPIQVERDSQANAITVTALGLSAERRQVLEKAFSGMDRVQLRFLNPQAVRELSRTLESNTTNQASPNDANAELQIGDRVLTVEFINSLLEASESALTRAHALRVLAEHFPPEIESQLASKDLAILDTLLAEHFAALRRASDRVLAGARQIAVLSSPTRDVAGQSWQPHASRLVTAVERVDRILTRLLAIGGGTSNQQILIPELDDALGRMEAEMARAEPVFRRAR
jgi:hypothetical protein